MTKIKKKERKERNIKKAAVIAAGEPNVSWPRGEKRSSNITARRN